MDETLMAKYWTEDSGNYDRVVKDELGGWQKEAWVALFRELIPKGASAALDFGCGPGFFSLLLSEAGLAVTGLDCSEGMIEAARRNTAGSANPPSFLQGDIAEADFPPASFDVIASRNVTWTLSDPEAVYRKCRELLKPKGLLLIFDANWNLPLFDEALAKHCAEREKLCIEKYGSTFDGPELSLSLDLKALPLSSRRRPEWDLGALREAGFSEARVIPGLIDRLWTEKEKLLYGETPLFGIAARA